MSALNNEYNEKEQKREVVAANFTVTNTEDGILIKKRTPQEQLEWTSQLAIILQKQQQAYNAAILKAYMVAKPPGTFDLDVATNVTKMRAFLHHKYGISVDSTGTVHVKPTGTPEERQYAVYLSVLEVQARSAVPILESKGGTVEEHISLLKALLNADCSIPAKRLHEVAIGINEHAKTLAPEAQKELEVLLLLSQANSVLHADQQHYEKPLNQVERRAKLVSWIDEHQGDSFTSTLKEALNSNDAQMASIGKSLDAKPAQRHLGWTRTSKFTAHVEAEPEVAPVLK